MKNIEDNENRQHACVIRDVKVSTYLIKDAVNKCYDIDVIKINNLLGPDGERMAHVLLAQDWNALDIVNKTGIIQTKRSYLIQNIPFSSHKKINVFFQLFNAIKLLYSKSFCSLILC